MTEKETTSKKLTTDKTTKKTKEPVDTAPYLKKADTNENTKSSNYVIPALFVLALSIVIVATFYADQFNSLVAKLNVGTDTQKTVVTSNETTTPAVEVSAIETPVITANAEINTETEVVSASAEETVAMVVDSEVNESVNPEETKKAETITNNVSAMRVATKSPTPFNTRPAWAVVSTPYTMGHAQSNPYNDMLLKQKEVYDQAMKKQHEMMIQMQEIRKAAFDRMQKQHYEMHLKMKEMRQKSMKIHYEMDKKMKDAYNHFHKI